MTFDSSNIDLERLESAMERTFRKLEVKDLVKTWVGDGPAFGVILEVHEKISGVSYDILVDGELVERPANYVVKPDEECPEWISFKGMTFPTVKRVYPALITNEIVSVQPMTMPSGLASQLLDYKYGDNNDPENDQT